MFFIFRREKKISNGKYISLEAYKEIENEEEEEEEEELYIDYIL